MKGKEIKIADKHPSSLLHSALQEQKAALSFFNLAEGEEQINAAVYALNAAEFKIRSILLNEKSLKKAYE